MVVVAVLSIYWLLPKQAIQDLTRVSEAKGDQHRLRTPGKISLRGPVPE